VWIRRLEVSDCAGIAGAAVDLLPGLNVLHGPNELGKSSLVEAVRAVLLLQSGSSAASVLDDWHGGGPPSVALTFEREERVWRVRKTFKKGGGQSFLDFSRDGRDFTTDKRGREVDGTLSEMLGWGARPPGGKGSARGMPSTLITTALLGRQDEVAAILEGSLAQDPTESGREQLMHVLEGLSEDPRLRRLLDAVQEKVDEAFTATGRRRSGASSPWTRLKEELRAAETRQQEVRARRDESKGVRGQVNDLQRELAEAEEAQATAARKLGEAQEALERHRRRDEAQDRFEAAEVDVLRIEKEIRTRDEKAGEADKTRGRIAELSTEHEGLGEKVVRLGERLEEARARIREMEAGGDEKGRRLREQEAKNTRLEVAGELDTFDRQVRDAERFADLDRQVGELDGRIEATERNQAQAQDLIEAAERETATDRRRLEALRVELLAARFLALGEGLKRRVREHEEARKHLQAAEVAEDEAASLRRAAADLQVPDREEFERLKTAEDDRLLARERLAVGLAVDLELEAGVTAEVRADGQADAVSIGEGRHADIEARRELRVDFPGVGVVRVRGGGRELAAAAEVAERELRAVRRPLLNRTGVSSSAELEELRRRAESMLGAAEEKEGNAAEAKIRAEGTEDLEREEALARGARDRGRRELAEALGDGVSVGEHLRTREAPPRLESDVSKQIEELEAQVDKRRERCRDLESAVERVAGDLERDRQERDARRNDLSRAGFDWRGVVADAERRRSEMERRLGAAEGTLRAVRAEAASEVEEARGQVEALRKDHAATVAERDKAALELSAARESLARLKGEVEVLEGVLEREDAAAAREERERWRKVLAELEEDLEETPTVDAAEVEGIAREAEEAGKAVAGIKAALLRQRGALEQVGGAYAEEQALQARERVEAVRKREGDLEIEYEAWKLLGETLLDVEKEETAHFGRALVDPVSERISDLTGGRYGGMAIGPDLDAMGIRLAGAERRFADLSVGTREQIATLLRISIAEALGTFVIFDDQLTQSDRLRLAWLRDLLGEAARRIQVVVMTCHPEDYEKAPGARVVDLTHCIRRSAPPV